MFEDNQIREEEKREKVGGKKEKGGTGWVREGQETKREENEMWLYFAGRQIPSW